MKIPNSARRTKRETGGAAVEMAIVLPILVVLLAFPFFVGRALMSYTIAQKAAHDAARFFSTVPQSEMKSVGRVKQWVAVAEAIADAETKELNLPEGYPVYTPLCNDLNCAGIVPGRVKFAIQFPVFDSAFGEITGNGEGIFLTTDVYMPYVGQ